VLKPFSDNEHLVPSRLDRSDVLCLKAFRAFRDIELYSLAFLQAAEAASLNSREMYKNVLAILTADKAETFGVVKPLHLFLFPLMFLFVFLKFLLRRVAAGEKG